MVEKIALLKSFMKTKVFIIQGRITSIKWTHIAANDMATGSN